MPTWKERVIRSLERIIQWRGRPDRIRCDCSRRILVAELYGKIDVVAEGENIYAQYNNATEKLLLASSGMSLKLVAGAGFVIQKQRLKLN
ncbi:hypothetical protein C798_08290 [Herbaspirillum rubrisubalbicans Os34]|uniref:Uncharacterized protein n=1 Tax=Herbaspirillum rubrisubalbicans Os34 TaxID=1235827 RepID=A0A6M3ZNR9_9BURK|nr:hypothetical protein C798_08290 [Herbaspirillum rubrisubalbicans Os34]